MMNTMSQKQLMRFITEVSFAMDDIALYLDLHPTCKQAMNWIAGTNVCACTNPGCLGIKRTRKNKEDENVEETYYTTAYHTLREADEKLAEKIFGGIK